VGDFWVGWFDTSRAKLQTKVCDCSLGRSKTAKHNAFMAKRSTDIQSFSGFAGLHRADLTHEPRKPQEPQGVPWGRIALVAVAGVIAAVVLRVLAAW
jgi:hypothetical protein